MNLRLRNFLPRSDRPSSLLRPQKLEESRQTTIIPSNFSSRIYGFRTTSSARPRRTACATCYFLEALYLSEVRAAADPRNSVAQRTAGADQRSLRNCEDCRRQALPGVLQRIRGEFYLGYADEPLRPERQFRSGDISRAGCAHAQSA